MKYNIKDMLNLETKLNFKLLNNLEDNCVLVRCNICGAIKKMKINTLVFRKKKSVNIHNQFCSKYYTNIAKQQIGEAKTVYFKDFYRHAHERCCNPNCKDYKKYKGKFLFKDFTDFFLNCFENYKQEIQTTDYKTLTIDRIDGNKGYEPGNVRFVSMYKNLRNRSVVSKILVTNIFTGYSFTTRGFSELSRVLNRSFSTLQKHCFRQKILDGRWKITKV